MLDRTDEGARPHMDIADPTLKTKAASFRWRLST
jgi:hypothetical protein